MEKDNAARKNSRQRSNQNLSREKVSQGKLIERIILGKYFIEHRDEYSQHEWRAFLKAGWNITVGNANVYMRIAEKFGDEEKMKRIIASDLPFDIIKKLSCSYITDEIIEQFYEQINPVLERSTFVCRSILNKIKDAHGISQMSWINGEEDDGEEDTFDAPTNRLSAIPETPMYSNMPNLEDPPFEGEVRTLDQYYEDIENEHLELSLTHSRLSNKHRTLADFIKSQRLHLA